MYVDTTYIDFNKYIICFCYGAIYSIFTYFTQTIGRDYEIMYVVVNARITWLYYKIKYFPSTFANNF